MAHPSPIMASKRRVSILEEYAHASSQVGGGLLEVTRSPRELSAVPARLTCTDYLGERPRNIPHQEEAHHEPMS
jgi:hypothetical protein